VHYDSKSGARRSAVSVSDDHGRQRTGRPRAKKTFDDLDRKFKTGTSWSEKVALLLVQVNLQKSNNKIEENAALCFYSPRSYQFREDKKSRRHKRRIENTNENSFNLKRSNGMSGELSQYCTNVWLPNYVRIP